MVNNEIYNLALEKYCELLRCWQLRENKYENIIKCKDSLKIFKGTLPCLKIIKTLIDLYPERNINFYDEISSQNQVMVNLIQKFDIITIMLEVKINKKIYIILKIKLIKIKRI